MRLLGGDVPRSWGNGKTTIERLLVISFHFVCPVQCAGADQGRCSMFSTKVWRSGCNLLRKLIAFMIAIRSWIVLTTVFAACSFAAAPDIPSGNPRIQGGNLRIEFDNHLHSRVVACFDKQETGMGPFSASETLTTSDKHWTEFLLTSQKRERTKDGFGEGQRLTVQGKAGTLTKM